MFPSSNYVIVICSALLVSSLVSAHEIQRVRDLSRTHDHSSRSFHKVHRSLPRVGKRLQNQKRGGGPEATVKCITEYTWSLCDGENCTDMGAVAAGTACIDNAITWAPTDAAPVNKPQASASPASSGSSVGTSKSAKGTPASNLSVKTKSDTSSSSSSSSSSGDSSNSTGNDDGTNDEDDDEDDDDDDDECDAEDDEAESTISSGSANSDTTTSSSPSSSSSSSPKPTQSTVTVNLAVQPSKTSSSSTAPSPTSTSGTGGGGGDGTLITGGFATFFYQEGAYGACGQIHSDSDKIVALQIDRYGTGSNNAPDCGKTVLITNTENGKSVTATVADACPGCQNYNSLDLSIGAFTAIADESTGVVPITWEFTS